MTSGVVPVPRYRFAVGPWNTGPVIDLTRATSRQVQLRASGDASLTTFTVDGRSPEGEAIQELISDVWVYRDGLDGNGPTLLTRCRVGGQPDDEIDEKSHTVAMSASDYRARLDRLNLVDSDTLTYTNLDAADIAWQVVSAVQGHSGGNLGITRGLHPTTFNVPSQTFDAGTSAYAALTTLQGFSTGFDWDIEPDTLKLDIWKPYRGRTLTDVYSFGDNIATVKRSWDTSTYGTATRTTGGNAPNGFPLAAIRNSIGPGAGGRYDINLAHPDISDTNALAQAATYDLAAASTPSPTYTCRLKPGVWSPSKLWLGDLIFLVVNSGRLAVRDWVRVQEIDISLDDNGGQETVDVTFGYGTFVSRRDLRRRLRSLGNRLDRLERLA